MAYNFPDNPTPGQVFQKWTWNGEAWVLTPPNLDAIYVNVTGDAMTGQLSLPTTPAPVAANAVRKDYVDAAIAAIPLPDLSSKAPIDSPAFTGNPTAPTPAAADNDTSIATTAFVKSVIPTSFPYLPLSGGTVSGPLTVTGELVAGASYIRMGTAGGPGYFQWSGGSSYNCGGSTIYTTANFNPASYLSNGRLPYAGDKQPDMGYGDTIANAVVSGGKLNGAYAVDGFRCRYVQGYTTGWFTYAFA